MPNATDAAELQAIFEGVDAARREAELTWGCERLPLIIGLEMRAKMRSQQRRFSEALQAAWAVDNCTAAEIQAVRDSGAAMLRMWPKLGEIAAEAGHRPQAPGILGERILPDGSVCIVVRDNDAAALINAEGRGCAVYTLDEVFSVIGSFIPEVFAQTKVHFPGAVFQGPRLDDSPEWAKRGDEIPFPHEEAA
jgi:hypothetical protein